MSALDRVTEALENLGCKQASNGGDWTCPAHRDTHPSLSVNQGQKGVLIHCHAGCPKDAVLWALGLQMTDLFDVGSDDTPANGKRHQVGAYPYINADGTLLYEVVRYEPKDFRQRVPEGSGWRWSMNGVERVLYRLPELLAGVADKRRVFVVEGEKDADALVARGEIATCNSGGAGKWRNELASCLGGALVYVVADRDEPGRKHAEQVRESLQDVAASVQVLEPKVGKDTFDHFSAGYDVDDLIGSAESELSVGDGDGPPVDDTPVVTNSLRASVLTYSQIKDIPPPTYLVEDLLVADSLFVLFGMPGSTKSFLALDWGLSIAHGAPTWMNKAVMAGPVLYVVAEGLSGTGQRVCAWEEDRGISGEGDLTWVSRAVNLLEERSVDELVEIADEVQPMAIFIDTLARSIPGADENAAETMSAAIKAMDRLRETTRAAVGCIHHTPKDNSSTPRGHSSLLGAVQTSIKVTKGPDGDVALSVEKQKDSEPISMNLRLRKVANSAVLYESKPVDRSGFAGLSYPEMEVMQIVREGPPEGLTFGSLVALTGKSKSMLAVMIQRMEGRKLTNLGSETRPRWAPLETSSDQEESF